MKYVFPIFFVWLGCQFVALHAQEINRPPLPAVTQPKDTFVLTLERTIQIARENSPDAIAARHSFRSSYWNYRSFRANYLPSLVLNAEPNLTRQISKIIQPDGSYNFGKQNQLSTTADLTVNQNIALTGGNVFLRTYLQRFDNFEQDIVSYQSNPIVIGYQQNLLGYNSLKWDRKIEPVRYEEAKKNYIETLEIVSSYAASKFFQLATAQTNLEIARFNYANADTLYRFAIGRYEIGTITENDKLQLEINLLSEQTNMMNASIEVDDCIQDLRSYLGIKEEVLLKVEVNNVVPRFEVPLQAALTEAYQNSSQIENMERRKVESNSNVAYAKSQTGFKADLYMEFGLTQTSADIGKAYRDPMNQQYVSLGIRVPILDWGVGKGKVKVAKSNRDKVYTQLEQDQSNFELNVLKTVKQFNLQADKVNIAYRTAQTAQRRNEVARKLYLLGKSSLLDLNASITEKDRARRDYISSLSNYWNLFYLLRSLTLYNFENGTPILEDYELLIK
ncbi:TolC family protein [Parabacteroides pacaensis]|uniref:TolC family protein n=1 Tax=Parabacteroides pacaensis TaxID=2086575 RepID=UPI000D10D39A|nr:TolC family protein [Parabacteroides pacaensis]